MNAMDCSPAPPPECGETLDFAFPEGTPDRLVDLRGKYGDFFGLRSLTRPDFSCYLLCEPELISQVLGRLNRRYTKGVGINRVNILLGRGLMVSEGELWKSQRRMIQPGFGRRRVEDYVRQIVRCTQHAISQCRVVESIDVVRMTSETSLDFILDAIFSTDIDEMVAATGANPFSMVAEEGARDLIFARKFRSLSGTIMQFVDRRRIADQAPQDLLSMLMFSTDRSGNLMSDRQLTDEVLTLVVAGHETTASALASTWIMLTKHPDIYEQLLAEATALTGDPETWPDQLPRTSAVLHEVLRLFPPGWMTARRAVDHHELGNYVVRAGSDVLISPYVVHRHPDHWEDPLSFRPERFLSPDQQSVVAPPKAYIPFSAGARNCIGDHLAWLEMKIHVAMMCRAGRFERIDNDPIKMEAQINLRPKPPVTMRFHVT